MNKEKIEQLVEVINQRKKCNKNTSRTDYFYIIALAKELFGYEINSGILREIIKDMYIIFYKSKENIKIADNETEYCVGTEESGHCYILSNNDGERKKCEIVNFANGKNREISFTQNGLHLDEGTLNHRLIENRIYDDNGFETMNERFFHDYSRMEVYKETITRNDDLFYTAIVKGVYQSINNESRDYEFETYLYKEPYSINQHDLFPRYFLSKMSNKSCEEEILEGLEMNKNYFLFPELKDIIREKIQNKYSIQK